MKITHNPWRGGTKLAPDAPYPSVAAARIAELLAACPAAQETPLQDASSLAPLARLWIKDERGRMNLGSFKALGAAYVIACDAAAITSTPGADSLAGKVYVTASAGNHGMSVAAGARLFGASAIIYIASSVPEGFAERLRAKGADVRREGKEYAAAMAAAAQAAHTNGWVLLSDSSWNGYTDIPYRLMEGYLQIAVETVRQCLEPPSHILLQAGVGGLAGAIAAYLRKIWGEEPMIVVVEPERAPALQASIEAGRAGFAPGPASIMGRLDCKEPSLIALNGLARDADIFLTLNDAEVLRHMPAMAEAGFATTPSGGAGLAAIMDDSVRAELNLGDDARALCILSEAPQ